jgi:hypothetical protein
MASEKIQTELLIKNVSAGLAPQQQAQAQKTITAQALATEAATQGLVESQRAVQLAAYQKAQAANFARATGARISARTRVYGDPQQGAPVIDDTGAQVLDKHGQPVFQTVQPALTMTVTSPPLAHLSGAQRSALRQRQMNILTGQRAAPPTPQESALVRSRAGAADLTAEEDALIKDILVRARSAGSAAQAKQKDDANRVGKLLRISAGLFKHDPVTGKVVAPQQLSAAAKAQYEQDILTSQDPMTKAYAQHQLQDEVRGEAIRAQQTRAQAAQAKRDRAEAQRHVDARDKTQRQLAQRDALTGRPIAPTQHSQSAINQALIDRTSPDPVVRRMAEEVLSDEKRRLPFVFKQTQADSRARAQERKFALKTEFDVDMIERDVGTLRQRMNAVAQMTRVATANAQLDQLISQYRAMSPRDQASYARGKGRELLHDIHRAEQDVRHEYREAEQEEEATKREAAAVKKRRDQQRSQTYLAIARGIAEGAGGVFDPNRSVMTTGLMGLGAAGGRMLMQSGAQAMAGGAGFASLAGGGALVGGAALLGGALLLKAGYDRGTELQNKAEKVYISAEPMFAREEQLRAARGDAGSLQQVRQFSSAAERRALAARGGSSAGPAGTATPSNSDIYSNLATNRFKTIQQFLGSSMGFAESVQAYGQFRRQSGVIDMSTAQAAEAMQTGLYSGVPLELLARASRLGTIPGNRGGGFRQGADGRLDIGTLRYQMETLGRAGLTGAPAEQILGQTLDRQSALAAAGLRTDFDRDAMFQRTLQSSGIAPEQFGGITGTLDDMRSNIAQQLQAPGKEILSGLMMVNAFKQGRTFTGAAEYVGKTSSAQQLEDQLKMVGPASGLLPLMATGLAPADQPSMMDALRRMRAGQSAGPAIATGEGTIDDAATGRGRLEYMTEFNAIGAQRSMGNKAEIAQFQTTLDSAAKSIKAAADSMQAVAASAGNLTF